MTLLTATLAVLQSADRQFQFLLVIVIVPSRLGIYELEIIANILGFSNWHTNPGFSSSS